MSRTLLLIFAAAVLCLPSCASTETHGNAPVKKSATAQNPTVITVAKNGAVQVDSKKIPLKKLAVTLKQMGLTKNSKFKVEGETGSNPEQIEAVLEILVMNGLLPKDLID